MRKVEADVLIKVSSQKTFAAFLEPDMLRGWWDVQKMLVEKKEGGVYTLTWNNSVQGFGYVFSGNISQYHPGELLVIDHIVYLNPERKILGPMCLAIKIEAKNDCSLLFLSQSGYQDGDDWDWYYEAVRSAWPVVLQTLQQYLEK